jgi:hypothetical protein
MSATWRATSILCRERGWSQQDLIYELEKGLPYRTDPPGWKVKWGSHLWPYFNVGASKLLVPPGGLRGVVPPPSTKRSDLFTWGVNLRIEVLPPGVPTDANVLASSAPAASPAPPRKVSDAELRDCILGIKKERPDDPPDEDELRKEVEGRLGVPIGRNRIRKIRSKYAREWVNPRGRPRKSAQF